MTAGAPDARSMAAAAAAAAVVREAAAAAVFDHLEGESGEWLALASCCVGSVPDAATIRCMHLRRSIQQDHPALPPHHTCPLIALPLPAAEERELKAAEAKKHRMRKVIT